MTTLQITSDSDNSTMDIIKDAIEAELKRLELGLQKTDKQIARFEDEYKISSEVFLSKFAAKDMKNGDPEYIAWAGELKIREKIAADINRLKEIRYVA